MDGHFCLSQGVDKQGPLRLQQNDLQPNIMQYSRPILLRERYRTVQHDHPRYDVVEDDGYGQGALLDSFGMCQMTDQPY